MKLTLLPDSSDGPVLLFARAEPRGAGLLKAALRILSACELTTVELHALPGIEAGPGAALVAESHPRQPAPAAIDVGRFVWTLTPTEWASVAGLLEPFAEQDGGERSQVLGTAGPATVVISTSDRW